MTGQGSQNAKLRQTTLGRMVRRHSWRQSRYAQTRSFGSVSVRMNLASCAAFRVHSLSIRGIVVKESLPESSTLESCQLVPHSRERVLAIHAEPFQAVVGNPHPSLNCKLN